eukprot:3563250-Prorocentrum_lima.AAC.1
MLDPLAVRESANGAPLLCLSGACAGLLPPTMTSGPVLPAPRTSAKYRCERQQCDGSAALLP